jgi:large subunit ribosomal protein L32
MAGITLGAALGIIQPATAGNEGEIVMPVPRRRHGKGRRDRSRTHVKLEALNIVNCLSCGKPKRPHRVCPHCGVYRGRTYRTTVTS